MRVWERLRASAWMCCHSHRTYRVGRAKVVERRTGWENFAVYSGDELRAAVLFGFTPALQIARQRRHKTLARQTLLSAQLAGGCVLLIVAGLLVRAAQHTVYTNPGFGYERLISIDGQLRQHGYTVPQAKGYLDAMRSRLGAMPGVRSVSLALLPPLGHTVSYATAVINDHNVRVYPNWVAPRPAIY